MAVSEVQDQPPTLSQAEQGPSPLGWSLLLFVCFAITSGYTFQPQGPADASEVATAIAASSGFGRARPLALLALGAIGCLALMRGRYSIIPRGLLGLFILLFVDYAAMSFFWADDTGTVIRRTAGLLLLLIAVAGAARLFTMATLRSFVCVTFGLALAIGLAKEVVVGEFAPLSLEYRFHGLTGPNTLGLDIAILLLAVIASKGDRGRWLRFAMIIGLFVLLAMTRSRGALGAAVASIIVWQLLTGRSLAQFAFRGLLALSLIVPLAFLAAGENLGSVVQDAVLLGRADQTNDPTSLTGRLPLWTDLIDHYVSDRPLLGYGFQGFWTPRHILEVSIHQDWAILFGHSAYMDMLLDLGLLGLVVYLLILSGAFLRSSRRALREESTDWAFAAAVLAAIIVNSVLETVLLVPSLQSFVGLVIILKAATEDASDRPPSVAHS